MKVKQSKHFRIRDGNAYNINIEEFIKHIEAKYNIEFKSLPQWKELAKRLHVMTTDYKRKLQDANFRKTLIMHKLFIEFTRPTPFELSEDLARTAKKWEKMLMKPRKRAIITKMEPLPIFKDDIGELGESEEVDDIPHPNTEINPSAGSSTSQTLELLANLPVYVCTNQHKLISTIASNDSALEPSSLKEIETFESGYEVKLDWMTLNQNKSVACLPKEIILKYDTLREQTLKFSLTNCSGEFVHVRFQNFTERSSFRNAKIVPVTPVILYPGVPVVYKLIFRLVERKKEFTSQLFFKVGRNVYSAAPVEALCIPIITKFIKARSVSVPKIVTIPPIYFWHMNMKYPKYPSAVVRVSVNDDRYYHLHIVKRVVDLSKLSDTTLSTEPIALAAAPVVQQEETNDDADEQDHQSKIKGKGAKQKGTKGGKEPKNSAKGKEALEAERLQELANEEFRKLTKDISSIVTDIVQLALEVFMFETTYLFLKPDVNYQIPVYLTEIENMGCHNCYYDFKLIDPETEDCVLTFTVRVFATILPHPIQVQPEILVMSDSHKIYGFCEDRFVVTNTHNVLPVTVAFKLPTEMKKIIRIVPMIALISALSSVVFKVLFCSRDRKAHTDDLVYFTFEIITIGHKSVYRDVPPIIYEIIAPCVEEFRKHTKTHYFRDLMNKRARNLT